MKEQLFDFVVLGEDNLPRVLELESVVLASLERPDLLRRNSPEMWQECLRPPHFAIGAVAEGRLVALAVLYIPHRGDAEDLSQSLITIDADKCTSANYKICIVHPQYRGHALQQRLGQMLENEARKRGVDLLCSTVSPYNPASIVSLQKIGYSLDCTLAKYGYVRQLFFKIL